MSQLNNDDKLIRGAGGGGSSSSSSSTTYTNLPDTLRSTDSFEILLGLGSGRWKGLVNGLKSLYINDVPLANADGTTNFKDITAIFADGDPANKQTVTFKLGGGGSVTNVSTAITNLNAPGTPGNYVVGATTTPNADFVDLRFVIQQLYHSTPTGIFNATASLDIQMRPSGTSTWINPLVVPPPPISYDPIDGGYTWTDPGGPVTGGGTTPEPGNGTGSGGYYPPTTDSGGILRVYPMPDKIDGGLLAPYHPSSPDEPAMRGATINPNDYFFTTITGDNDYAGGSSVNTVTPLTTGYSGPLVITGKTMGPAVRELRIAVPKTGVYANKTWEIRVRLIEPSHNYLNVGTSTQEEFLRTIAFESITAVNKGVLGLSEEWRGLAWMQVVGKASDQLNGFPSIKGIYDTKIVKVPPLTVFNPDTRVYTGTIWNGTYANAYTNDPAWCIKDLIEDPISGIAAMSPGATLDKWDALEASKYCSALVSNGRGAGTHPRFSMNIRLEEAMNAEEMIQNLAGAFNGLCVDTGAGKWRLKIDKPETPVATYTLDNIIGEFQYSHTDIDTRFNDITMTFLNEELGYLEDRLRVYDKDHIARYGRKSTTMIAVGATHRQEVLRRAVLRLRTSINENKIVKFTTNRQGRLLEPLQTIFVADQHLGYAPSTPPDTDPFDNRTTSRMTGLDATKMIVTLGRTVRLEVGVTYKAKFTVPNPNYNPEPSTQPTSADWKLPTIVIERTLTNTSLQRGDTNTLYLNTALPANVPPNAVVALDAVGLPALPIQYRILEISPTAEESVGVTAIIIDTGKYTAADTATGSDIDAWVGSGNSGDPNNGGGLPGSSIDRGRPTVPTSGMFNLTEYMKDGQKHRLLTATWVRPVQGNNLNGYKVERKIGDGAWTIISPLTSQTSIEITDPAPGTNWFRITPINLKGRTQTALVGGYDVPTLAGSILYPHSYGLIADRPTTGMVTGQLYTAIDQPLTPTYRYSGSAWLAISTNGADINGDGIPDGGAGGIIDSGDVVEPTRRRSRGEIKTILGTAAAITGQGTLATKSTVSASLLELNDLTNLYKDPDFLDPLYQPLTGTWSYSTETLVTNLPSAGGMGALKAIKTPVGDGTTTQAQTVSDTAASYRIKVKPGTRLRLETTIGIKSGFSGFAAVGFRFFDKNGSSIIDSSLATSADYRTTAAAADTVTTPSISITVPADARTVHVRFTVIWSTTLANAQYALFASPKITLLTKAGNDLTSNLVGEDGTQLTDAIIKTSLGTAAAITGQGALATKSTAIWSSDISGSGKPKNYASIGDNLVPNGDFESGMDGWAIDGGAPAVANATAGSPFQKSLKGNATWNTHGVMPDNNQYFIPVGPYAGKKMFIEFWHYGPSGGAASAQLFGSYTDKDKNYLDIAFNMAMNTTGGWYNYTYEWLVPAAAVYLTLFPSAYGTGQSVEITGIRVSATEKSATLGADLNVNVFDTFTGTKVTVPRNETKTALGTAAAITGQGALATKSAVDLTTADVTNKSLANLDSTANTKLSGIEASADVTSYIVGAASMSVGYNSDGTQKASQVPKTETYTYYKSGTAITSGVTWSVTKISGTSTASITGSGAGTFSLDTFSATSKWRIKASYSGSPDRTFDVTITKVTDPAVAGTTGGGGGGGGGGGSGSTNVYFTSFSIINSTSYPADASPHSGPLICKTGATGKLTVSGTLEFMRAGITVGSQSIYGKVRYRTSGSGSYADIGTEDISTTQASYDSVDGATPGYCTVSMQKTGLAANTDYDVIFMARNSGGVNAAITDGQITVTGS